MALRNYKSMFLLCLCLLLLSQITYGGKIDDRCKTCRQIVENFKKGMEKTAKNHFGGGDTAWEESRLGSYTRSETRFLEILEGICDGANKESSCHAMVEEHEELMEKLWFNKHNELAELENYLCIETLKVCCPEGTWGEECTECPGGKDNPCFGKGTCKGAGTRDGTGKCDCTAEYIGDKCEECNDEYYDDGNGTCKKCHESCASSCSDGTSKGCDGCKEGYIEDEEQSCVDRNECDEDDICKEGTFCMNTIGSYKCHDCDPACDGGCTGTGRLSCINCATGWKLLEEGNGCEDINECDTPDLCTVGTHCVNTDGSHKCEACHHSCDSGCTGEGPAACVECTSGYKWSDEGCVDVDECVERNKTCPAGHVCINKDGPDTCEPCDSSCLECVSAGPKGCLQCKPGFMFKDDGCEDIDECAANPCNKKTENCQNAAGSYRCKCKKGFVRTKKGDCIKKIPQGKTGNKLSTEQELEVDILEGNVFHEGHMKIGSLLYAGFFGMSFLLFKYGRYYSIAALVLIHCVVVIYINQKYNKDIK